MTSECPVLAFFILEIMYVHVLVVRCPNSEVSYDRVNTAMICEVSIRLVAFGKVSGLLNLLGMS